MDARRGSGTPWALLVGVFLLVTFLEAALDGGWIFFPGMALSAAGAGVYYLCTCRPRTRYGARGRLTLFGAQ